MRAGEAAVVEGMYGGAAGVRGDFSASFLVVFAQGTVDECRVPSGLTLKVKVNACCALR